MPQQRPLGAGYWQYILSADHSNPSITHCLVAIIHIKPVNSKILAPELVAMATTLAWSQKPTPGIKQRVASYHITKVLAHKACYSKLSPKLVAIATSLTTSEPPSNTWFLWSIQTHNPNGISIGSAVFAQMTAECTYTSHWEAPFPLKIAPFHGEIWTPI